MINAFNLDLWFPSFLLSDAKGPFTLSLAIAIPKSDSLAIVMLAKEMAYPTHSLSFSTGITKDFAKASVKGTIDNIEFPFFWHH